MQSSGVCWSEIPGFCTAILAPHIGGEFYHIPNSHIAVKGSFGRHISDAGQDLLLLAADIHPENLRASLGWCDQSEQGADRGTLSGAVRSDETEEVPLRYGQVHICDPS